MSCVGSNARRTVIDEHGRSWCMRVVQPVWQDHDEIADGGEQSRDAHDAWLVTTSTEVADENNNTHVHDVAARHHHTRLSTAQSEAPFQRPHHPGRVDDADHPQPDDTSGVRSEQRYATSPLSTVFRFRHVRRFLVGGLRRRCLRVSIVGRRLSGHCTVVRAVLQWRIPVSHDAELTRHVFTEFHCDTNEDDLVTYRISMQLTASDLLTVSRTSRLAYIHLYIA